MTGSIAYCFLSLIQVAGAHKFPDAILLLVGHPERLQQAYSVGICFPGTGNDDGLAELLPVRRQPKGIAYSGDISVADGLDANSSCGA